MAWFKRRPDKHAGVLFHSDRGSQYASGAFRDALKDYGILSSMSRRANCWDNACSETLFGSLKVERLHGQRFVTRRQAKDETCRVAAVVQQNAAAFNAGLCQPDAVRKRMACQASQLMSSVMGYAIQGQGQLNTSLQFVHLAFLALLLRRS